MNVNFVNPFIEAFNHVMGQIGFSEIKHGTLSVKRKQFTCTGVILKVGITGDLRGNVVYVIDSEEAKKIASVMMMGAPITKLDAISRSSLSELSNMLSANAATFFSKSGVLIDISPPTFFQGDDLEITMSSEMVLCIPFTADGTTVEINISFGKIN